MTRMVAKVQDLPASVYSRPSAADRSRGATIALSTFLVLALLLCLPLAVTPAQAQVPCCMVEEEIEDTIEDDITDDVEGDIEDDIEDRVDQGVGETIETSIENTIQDVIDDSVEESVEETVATTVEMSVEASVEGAVEDTVSSAVETSVEDSVERSVTDSVEDSVEQSVATSVEGAVEESVADSVEGTVEESVAASVEQSVDDAVEDSVAGTVETAVEESVEESVTGSVENSVEDAVEETVAGSVESAVEEGVVSSIEDRMEAEIDSILDGIESKLEVDESRIHTEQWLVMAEPEVFRELADKGYLFDRVTDLPGMGLQLAEVAAPSSFEIYDVREGVIDVVGRGRAEVDLNHLYTAGAPVQHSVQGSAPGSMMTLPGDTGQMPLRLGMIDSQVDTTHPALAAANIESRAFVREGAVLPSFHGTAIASILTGNDGNFLGLAPAAQLYAAAVFEQDEARGEIASTVSLVRALDWLMSSGVDVVNISLAGPPNRLLETALLRASEKGVLVLAAAGNGGPVAQPMYPAAYESVMAVTAVDGRSQVFRLANRGSYLDLAAPGVGLLHARSGGGYATSSGTSFAVPFAATMAARLRYLSPASDIRSILTQSAEDLGPPGFDEIYGYGLLRAGG